MDNLITKEYILKNVQPTYSDHKQMISLYYKKENNNNKLESKKSNIKVFN